MNDNAVFGPVEFYKKRFEIENKLTRNILESIPPDGLDYLPHARSASAGEIAWRIVRGLCMRIEMVAQADSYSIRDPHPELPEILDRFESRPHQHAAQLESFLNGAGNELANYAWAIVYRSRPP